MDLSTHRRLSVAPMMAWTDRHCRFFHRQISREALLYTEMVTSAALVRGQARHLLEYSEAEHPVALQLGGSDAQELATATRMACDAGYDEVNLNVGCPSDRVQSGTFGAVLMKTPEVVADCVSQMAAVSSVPVTVKCRIGVDDQNPAEVLPHFLSTMRSAGVRHVIVHARKAWLKGLSPKENREVPPLDYPLVQSMLAAFPDMHIAINGGVGNLTEAQQFLDAGFCGVMIGRAAYHTPYDILGRADAALWSSAHHVSRAEVIAAMGPYIAAHLQSGGTLHQVTRHMLGLFAGQPGARAWRRILSEGATRPGAGLEVLQAAYNAVSAASSIAHPNAAE